MRSAEHDGADNWGVRIWLHGMPGLPIGKTIRKARKGRPTPIRVCVDGFVTNFLLTMKAGMDLYPNELVRYANGPFNPEADSLR